VPAKSVAVPDLNWKTWVRCEGHEQFNLRTYPVLHSRREV
jgi:hypothetical protein